MENKNADVFFFYVWYWLQEQSDLHLKDYDEEIFDDDDFYHQVTKTSLVRSVSRSFLQESFCHNLSQFL